jgi:hypothetical protein
MFFARFFPARFAADVARARTADFLDGRDPDLPFESFSVVRVIPL